MKDIQQCTGKIEDKLHGKSITNKTQISSNNIVHFNGSGNEIPKWTQQGCQAFTNASPISSSNFQSGRNNNTRLHTIRNSNNVKQDFYFTQNCSFFLGK